MLYLRLLVAALFASVRARRDLVLENLALRHQLAVYTRGRRRPRLRRHDRRLWSLRARGWSGWRGTLVMVEPDTVVRWHRSAWRAYWRWKSRRRSGRPRIPAELRQLIVRIATEHPRWGAVRIVGELRALGFEVSARTVSRYRRQALRRPPSQSWRTFLRNHASSIWAADLFTVQTLAFRTLYVLIVIDHDRRRIRHWNVTEHPNAPWIWQQMIEATAWGQQPGFLIRDRDRSYGGDFIARPALQRDASASIIGARLSGGTQAGVSGVLVVQHVVIAAKIDGGVASIGGDDHVGGLDQGEQPVAFDLAVEVQFDRALATQPHWRVGQETEGVTAGALDLDHVGAEVSEDHRGDAADRPVGQVDHANVAERTGHLDAPFHPDHHARRRRRRLRMLGQPAPPSQWSPRAEGPRPNG